MSYLGFHYFCFCLHPHRVDDHRDSLLCPAFLSFLTPWDGLETVPIVALIHLVSPDGSLIKHFPEAGSLRILALVPAAQTIFAPCPGLISMLWMIVPMHIIASGMELAIIGLMSMWSISSCICATNVLFCESAKPTTYQQEVPWKQRHDFFDTLKLYTNISTQMLKS